MGVDLGSTTAKTVVLDEQGEMVASTVVQMGAVSRAAVRASMDEALERAGVQRSDIVKVVSTGYGRRLVQIADSSFTEITCHARGAAVLWPGARLVIDIGGQDSKVIAVDDGGLVRRFAMNDRCAGGTGRFFEGLARALEVDLEEVGPLAMEGAAGLEISSMCATFGETEVISLIASGEDRADIAAAVHEAVTARTVGLVGRVGKVTPIVMTGGVAKNRAAVESLSRALGVAIQIPEEPQIAGAYGAALLARDAHEQDREAEELLPEAAADGPASPGGDDDRGSRRSASAATAVEFPDPATVMRFGRS